MWLFGRGAISFLLSAGNVGAAERASLSRPAPDLLTAHVGPPVSAGDASGSQVALRHHRVQSGPGAECGDAQLPGVRQDLAEVELRCVLAANERAER